MKKEVPEKSKPQNDPTKITMATYFPEIHKVCLVIKETNLNLMFCLIKSPEIIFIFQLHFT